MNKQLSIENLITQYGGASSSTPYHELVKMLDCISEGFFTLDCNWRITYLNHWIETKFGLQRQEHLFQNIWTVFPFLEGTTLQSEFYKAVQDNVTVKFEQFSHVYKSWFEVTAHPSNAGLLVFLRDINQRKQEQEELRLSNERFRLAAKTDAIYDWNLVTNHLYWGEGLEEIFGYTSAELQIESWAAAIHPDDQNWLVEDLFQTVQNPAMNMWKREYRLRKKDGSTCYVYERGQILRNKDGIAVRMVGVMHDISSRKIAEEELQKLSLIAQKTVNAVFVTDVNHRITWINEAFTTMFEYSFQEAQGKIPRELLDCAEADPKTMEQMQRKAATGEGFHVEILNRTKNGHRLWCDSTYQPVHNQNGEIIQYFCIITDITECKNLQRRLEMQRRMTTAAVIKTQERERAHVGRELHDNVNQVLTTVKLYQELIASGVGDRDELVKKSTLLLQQSIDDIRSLSKRLSAPTLGNIRLKDSVMELLLNVAATDKFDLQYDCSSIDGLEVSEELHLAVFRILQEQLTNILKYAEATNVHVSCVLKEDFLLLQIMDNGKGFDAKQKRSGIGITNMMMRAESLNGSLFIDSQPGKGCKLTTLFPIDRNEQN